ncbi:MAG: hypothetical protein ABR915_02735 [Thermoguttaceae bacterium]|jgi:hypothetical protein
MASLGRTTFKGRSGRQYRFKVFPLGTRFRKISGVYVVANRARGVDGEDRHAVLYVGHTEDFSQPFNKHRKAKDLAQHGANCICVQSDKSEESRLEKQQDLIAAFSPECNE